MLSDISRGRRGQQSDQHVDCWNRCTEPASWKHVGREFFRYRYRQLEFGRKPKCLRPAVGRWARQVSLRTSPTRRRVSEGLTVFRGVSSRGHKRPLLPPLCPQERSSWGPMMAGSPRLMDKETHHGSPRALGTRVKLQGWCPMAKRFILLGLMISCARLIQAPSLTRESSGSSVLNKLLRSSFLCPS